MSGVHDTKNCKVQSSNHFRTAQQEPGCGILDKAARRSDRIVLYSFVDDHAYRDVDELLVLLDVRLPALHELPFPFCMCTKIKTTILGFPELDLVRCG